jgi:hypothetical protein
VKVSILVEARLIVEKFPRTQEEREDMARVPYASVVGSLIYAMFYTQPDISHAVGVLSRYFSITRNEHWITIKRLFRYLCGTKDYSICYQGKTGGESELNVHVFFDTDWVGDLDRQRSTSGVLTPKMKPSFRPSLGGYRSFQW